jgi:hypothetical protein
MKLSLYRCYTNKPIEADVPISKRTGGCDSAVLWSRSETSDSIFLSLIGTI